MAAVIERVCTPLMFCAELRNDPLLLPDVVSAVDAEELTPLALRMFLAVPAFVLERFILSLAACCMVVALGVVMIDAPSVRIIEFYIHLTRYTTPKLPTPSSFIFSNIAQEGSVTRSASDSVRMPLPLDSILVNPS